MSAPTYRVYATVGQRLREVGAAWPNRNADGWNVTIDLVSGPVTVFITPGKPRAGEDPTRVPEYRVAYRTGRQVINQETGEVRSFMRDCGIASTSADHQGLDLYIADPSIRMNLKLRPPMKVVGTAEVNDDTGEIVDPETGEILENAEPAVEQQPVKRRRAS